MEQGTSLASVINDLIMQKMVDTVLDTLRLSMEPQPYGKVASVLGLHPQDPNLYRCLDATIAEDIAKGRPLRAALVVSKRSGLPSDAFFEKARALGVAVGPDNTTFWASEMARLAS